MDYPQAIVLDLGNVIIEIDPQRTLDAFRELLGPHYELAFKQGAWKKLHHTLELGQISQLAFLNRLQWLSPVTLSSSQLLNAWNAVLIGVPEENVRTLEALGEKYPLYLLSNTDALHIDWIRKYFKQHYDIDQFDTHFFEKAFFSYELGMRKPMPQIYSHILEELGWKDRPGEVLFIDDKEENIRAASQQGWQVVHHPVGALLSQSVGQLLT